MKIQIQEAWWSAWKTFNWAKGIWGIGINSLDVEKAITNKEVLEIKVGKDTKVYRVSPTTVKNYATKNNWTFNAKGTLLYVMPHNLLR